MIHAAFYQDSATTAIYTLSLHGALPISPGRPSPRAEGRSPRRAPGAPVPAAVARRGGAGDPAGGTAGRRRGHPRRGRKSTRLNSSHMSISYAVFFLLKKYYNQVIYSYLC